MGFNFRQTRYSAICHLILGALCVIFGIADRATMYKKDAFHTEGVIAIWMGVWFFVTGFLGIFTSQRVPNSDRPRAPLVGTYLAFSIVAIVFAGVMLICYAIGIAIIQSGSSCSEQSRGIFRCDSYPYNCQWVRVSRAAECRTSVGLGAMVIIFAAAEFGVGIWASICCCMGNGCSCCCDTSSQQGGQGQVMYLQTQGGPVATYVMTQGPSGMPVAVPVMTGGAVQTQAVGGQAYMMQNPQAATAMTPPQYVQGGGQVRMMQNPQAAQVMTTPQYVQGTGGQVHMTQNPHGATAMSPSQQVQGIPTSVDAQQQVVSAQHAFNTPANAQKVPRVIP